MTDRVLSPAHWHLRGGSSAPPPLPGSAPFPRPACCLSFAIHVYHFIPLIKNHFSCLKSRLGFLLFKKVLCTLVLPNLFFLGFPPLSCSSQPSPPSPELRGLSLPCCCCRAECFLPCPSLARLTSSQVHLRHPHCPQTLLALLSDRLLPHLHFTS